MASGNPSSRLHDFPGGYDCHFIEDPPDELVCQICTLVAQHPYQVSCCGRVFCKNCLEEYRRHLKSDTSKFHCPNCRKRATVFHDRRGSRNIKCLKVKCNYKDGGCDWEGELFYLDEHLDCCPYAQIPCPNKCPVLVSRRDVRPHLDKECCMRRHRCADCNISGPYEHIMTKHKSECPEAIISCPHDCGSSVIVRHLLSLHLSTCPNQIISCPFSEMGCREKFPRKDTQKHEAEGTQAHLQLAMATILKLKRPVAVFRLSDYSVHKNSCRWWYSAGFYTHPGGYKLCLGVSANGNGDGENTHMSVYVYRLRGENDDNLVWPFRGQVTFQLLNQLQDTDHCTRTVPFDFHGSNEFNSRVIKGERSSQGWGYNKFLSHVALGYKKGALYLKDDALYFRIASADVYSGNKPWLSCMNPQP